MFEGSGHHRTLALHTRLCPAGWLHRGLEVFEVSTSAVSGPPFGDSRRAGSAPPPASRRGSVLLGRADALLSQSAGASSPADRFHSAYLAALRGAAAILATAEVGSSGTRRARTRNAWVLLADAAPDLANWAEYFAGHSATRAAIEAGMSRTLTDWEADEFFLDVGRFLQAVEDRIGYDIGLGLRAS
ncbi:SAV_6107 family HEPN domain-containing protein [Rhodococcus sp. NPDC049939]|uniref:SAV_6107 family HEPN domain-containing protein n=1 Tax=Rhodococcus sp. NPDC049939 TaxID=3155511 RepID=UPI0033D8B9F4